MARAVAAGRAGQHPPFDHALGDGQKCPALLIRKRLVFREGGDVLLHLAHIRHARKDHLHLRDALQKAERPGGDALFGAERPEFCLVCGGKGSELSAAQRLHHPHGDVPRRQKLHFFFGVLEGPVEIVDLQLAKFHILPILFQKAADDAEVAVRRKAEVADAPAPLLLGKVGEDAVALVYIVVDVHLAHVVEEIEVEVVRLALLQLRLKDLFHLVHIGKVVAGELAGKIVAAARVPRKELARDALRFAVVIPPGGVVIVDAAAHGIV